MSLPRLPHIDARLRLLAVVVLTVLVLVAR
jgi:hypothetical protein